MYECTLTKKAFGRSAVPQSGPADPSFRIPKSAFRIEACPLTLVRPSGLVTPHSPFRIPHWKRTFVLSYLRTLLSKPRHRSAHVLHHRVKEIGPIRLGSSVCLQTEDL